MDGETSARIAAVPEWVFAEALGIGRPLPERAYRQMRLIRLVEEALLDLFSKNQVFGTTHTCIGQEASAADVIDTLDRGCDMVWSNHRGHGHFLAYCGHDEGLLAEILGRGTGVCGGRGGSEHLHWRGFRSSGIQGGLVPVAIGATRAVRETGAISVVFLGDGTMGEGVVYEGLNLASLWSLPVLFVVEDNGIAQTTPRRLGVAGYVAARAAPFGIRCFAYAGWDVLAIHQAAEEAVAFVRQHRRPAWLYLATNRLGPHSKGDDTRTAEERAALAERDPLAFLRPTIANADDIGEGLVRQALERALKAPLACASSIR